MTSSSAAAEARPDSDKQARLAERMAAPQAFPTRYLKADVVIVAVPFDQFVDVRRPAGAALSGKIVIDVSNPVAS